MARGIRGILADKVQAVVKELAEEGHETVIWRVATNGGDIAVEIFVIAVARDIVGISVLLIVLAVNREFAITCAAVDVAIV